MKSKRKHELVSVSHLKTAIFKKTKWSKEPPQTDSLQNQCNFYWNWMMCGTGCFTDFHRLRILVLIQFIPFKSFSIMSYLDVKLELESNKTMIHGAQPKILRFIDLVRPYWLKENRMRTQHILEEKKVMDRCVGVRKWVDACHPTFRMTIKSDRSDIFNVHLPLTTPKVNELLPHNVLSVLWGDIQHKICPYFKPQQTIYFFVQQEGFGANSFLMNSDQTRITVQTQNIFLMYELYQVFRDQPFWTCFLNNLIEDYLFDFS